MTERHRWRVQRWLLEDSERPRACLQLFERRFLGLATVGRLLRGPLWLDRPPTPREQAAAWAALRLSWRKRRLRFLLLMPELAEGEDSVAGLRAASLRPVVTGYTTAWLDLRPDREALRAGLEGRWRNQLRQAEANDLETVTLTGEALAGNRQGAASLDWLLKRHDALRKRRRFVASSGAFHAAMVRADPGRALLVQVRRDGLPLAGGLFFRHGLASTYAAGWSGPEGRAARAQNLLLWEAVLALKAEGSAWLDLGGLTPEAAGVARFKLGLGGEVERLVGTWM